MRNWRYAEFRGGGMRGPLQGEKMRMLRCEGVRFVSEGQVSVAERGALWKFGEAGDG